MGRDIYLVNCYKTNLVALWLSAPWCSTQWVVLLWIWRSGVWHCACGRTSPLGFFTPLFAFLRLLFAALLGLLTVLRVGALLTSLGPFALTVHCLLLDTGISALHYNKCTKKYWLYIKGHWEYDPQATNSFVITLLWWGLPLGDGWSCTVLFPQGARCEGRGASLYSRYLYSCSVSGRVTCSRNPSTISSSSSGPRPVTNIMSDGEFRGERNRGNEKYAYVQSAWSFNTDPAVEQTGALYEKVNRLFPEADVMLLWVQLSPETINNQLQYVWQWLVGQQHHLPPLSPLSPLPGNHINKAAKRTIIYWTILALS